MVNLQHSQKSITTFPNAVEGNQHILGTCYDLKKVKQSHYKPGQALREISRQSAHEGGKVVNPMHRPPLPPGNIPGTHFCQRLSQPQGHSAAGRIMSMKNSSDTIGNRTHDLPTCSAVPQPTAPPRGHRRYVCVLFSDDGGWLKFECGTLLELYWGGKNRNTRRENPESVPLCLLQIPHRLAWDWTQARAIRGQPLTAWAIAWPGHWKISVLNSVRGRFSTLHN
jgi:hypothetical protein